MRSAIKFILIINMACSFIAFLGLLIMAIGFTGSEHSQNIAIFNRNISQIIFILCAGFLYLGEKE